jgi:hypothetical protein
MAEISIETMSEQEMRARAEAMEMGRMAIIEVAIAALIMQVPHPDLVEQGIAIRLDELKNATLQADHLDAIWAPATIHAGAEAAAERILHHWRTSRPGR